jgi:hypothetical protein
VAGDFQLVQGVRLTERQCVPALQQDDVEAGAFQLQGERDARRARPYNAQIRAEHLVLREFVGVVKAHCRCAILSRTLVLCHHPAHRMAACPASIINSRQRHRDTPFGPGARANATAVP